MVSDETAYRKYLAGDEAAAQLLVERYGDALTLYINGVLGEALAETGLFQNEQHQQLYAALGKLKKEYRETLFLVYFEELSYRQAAQVLGRTEQQVTNLVYRGKQQLKQLLEQEGYQYEN